MEVLLDTCTILWIVSSPDRLTGPALEILQDDDTMPFVSAISAAEIACGCERGRIELDRHWKTWFRYFIDSNQWMCLPVDLSIAEEAYSLPPPFHADPADRILVATARLHGLKILTADRRILDYPHVETIW
jgi:PIN domain nuclease of toxin-antitoxin system